MFSGNTTLILILKIINVLHIFNSTVSRAQENMLMFKYQIVKNSSIGNNNTYIVTCIVVEY